MTMSSATRRNPALTASLMDVLSDLQGPDAAPAPSSQARRVIDVDRDRVQTTDGRYEIDAEIDLTDAAGGLPEGTQLFGHRARDMRPPSADGDTASPTPAPAAAPVQPPIEDRIKQMPRFSSTEQVSHPTGEHWIAPAERALLGRPPA